MVAKEVRVLLALWLGCLAALGWLAALGAVRAVSDGAIYALGLLAYGGASIMLGAQSIGHEYTDRTLPLLLSQPVSRARLFLVKQSVLAVMLLILAGVAWTTVFFPSNTTANLLVLSLLGGLFVAPWLTMLTRNPLAGTVFTIQIPGFVWVGAQLLFGRGDQRVVVFWGVTFGVCAVAAALGFRMFMRLEAIDGRGADLRLSFTRPAAVPGPRQRNAVWLLMKKELALQQLSFALVAFYCAGWLVLLVTGQLEPSGRLSGGATFFGGITILYCGMLALLIGALASAEERQLGTLEWQVLLPMASAKQWAVKAGMAIGLSALLAVGLPALLLFVSGITVRMNALSTAGVLLMTVVSLYVSSLCSNGLLAFLLSLPVTFMIWMLIVYFTKLRWWSSPLLLGPVAALVVVVLWLAFENHRSAGRRRWLLRW